MIHHVIRIRFVAEFAADLRAAWVAQAQALDDLPFVHSVTTGAVAAIPPDGSECCAIFALADEAAYRAFLNAPALQALESWMRPVAGAVQIFDVHDPADEDLPRRLMMVRLERAAPSA